MRTTTHHIRLVFLSLLLTTLLTSFSALASETVTGRVVKVSDGDTLTLQMKNRTIKVRLAEIDTPEKAQPYGLTARTALVNKVMNKTIVVRIETTDRYGRSIGHIFFNDRDINREMVKEGHAWVYRQYLRDQSLLLIEKQARLAKRGLWALPINQRQAPWEWRKNKRNNRSTTTQPQTTNAQKGCDSSKRYCKHMASCAEARFYLQQCGRTRMDGDKDGVPCESTLCRK